MFQSYQAKHKRGSTRFGEGRKENTVREEEMHLAIACTMPGTYDPVNRKANN